MKIHKLISENFKKLNVQVELNGKSVKITGKNGAGKSTFIDAIFTTLTGKDIPAKPIQKGKAKAVNKVIIKNDKGEEITVERTFTESRKTLKVTHNGAPVNESPQAFLNEILGNISFDPFDFIRKDPREKKAILMRLAELDFSPIDEEKKELLAKKLLLENSIKANTQKISNKKYIDGYPESEINVQKLFDEITELNGYEYELNKLRDDAKRLIEDNKKAESRITELMREIESLQTGIEDNDKLIKVYTTNAENFKSLIAGKAQKQEQLDKASETNSIIKSNKEYLELKEAIDTDSETKEQLAIEIKQLEDMRVKMIAEAPLPVEGLEFTEDGVLFDGLPLEEEQLSHAKLIEIGIKISMALNPKLRIIRIKDGSLLDEEMYNVIQSAVNSADYQMFVETVTNDKQIGFVIEEEDK